MKITCQKAELAKGVNIDFKSSSYQNYHGYLRMYLDRCFYK